MREHEELAMFLCHLCYMAEAIGYAARQGQCFAFAASFKNGQLLGIRSQDRSAPHQRAFDSLAKPFIASTADMIVCFTVNYYSVDGVPTALYELTGMIPGTRNRRDCACQHFVCWEHTFALPIAENA